MTEAERTLLLRLAQVVARLDSMSQAPSHDFDAVRRLAREVEQADAAPSVPAVADLPSGRGPFVLETRERLSAAMVERLLDKWRRAFVDAGRDAPVLLVIDGGATLRRASAAE
jgi:hypothetical protein